MGYYMVGYHQLLTHALGGDDQYTTRLLVDLQFVFYWHSSAIS